jgi:hypothetical protein
MGGAWSGRDHACRFGRDGFCVLPFGRLENAEIHVRLV